MRPIMRYIHFFLALIILSMKVCSSSANHPGGSYIDYFEDSSDDITLNIRNNRPLENAIAQRSNITSAESTPTSFTSQATIFPKIVSKRPSTPTSINNTSTTISTVPLVTQASLLNATTPPTTTSSSPAANTTASQVTPTTSPPAGSTTTPTTPTSSPSSPSSANTTLQTTASPSTPPSILSTSPHEPTVPTVTNVTWPVTTIRVPTFPNISPNNYPTTALPSTNVTLPDNTTALPTTSASVTVTTSTSTNTPPSATSSRRPTIPTPTNPFRPPSPPTRFPTTTTPSPVTSRTTTTSTTPTPSLQNITTNCSLGDDILHRIFNRTSNDFGGYGLDNSVGVVGNFEEILDSILNHTRNYTRDQLIACIIQYRLPGERPVGNPDSSSHSQLSYARPSHLGNVPTLEVPKPPSSNFAYAHGYTTYIDPFNIAKKVPNFQPSRYAMSNSIQDIFVTAYRDFLRDWNTMFQYGRPAYWFRP